MTLLLGGAAQVQVELLLGDIADLPVPGTIVLDLPEEGGSAFSVDQYSHREKLRG